MKRVNQITTISISKEIVSNPFDYTICYQLFLGNSLFLYNFLYVVLSQTKRRNLYKQVTSHNSLEKIVKSKRFEAISLKLYISYLCSLCGMQFCECVLHQIIDFFGFSLLHLAFLPIFSMIAASKQCRLILKVLAMRGGFHSLSLPKLMRHLVTKLHSELLHTKVSSQTTQLSSHDSVLEATVVKNVEKIFAYFSKIFPDFKTGAKIL